MAILDDLMPSLYVGLGTVAREMVGFIPSVNKNTGAERAAKGEKIIIPTGRAGQLEDISEAMQTPSTNPGSLGYVEMEITNSKVVPFYWTGEEQKGIANGGQYNKVIADQFSDCLRKLVNAVEMDLAEAADKGSSRAYGTAGTTPFGVAGDFSDFANMAKILDDNGTPVSDRALVLNSAAFANLRGKQNLLLKVNEAGTDDFLRTGYTSPIQGFSIWNSAGIKSHKKGTGSGYVTNLAETLKTGATEVGIDTGSGTVLEGDIVTFADDENKYVVNKGATAPGNIILGTPGIMQDLADGKAMTIGADHTASYAFHKDAICLIARAPAVPTVGDNAIDSTIITDPVSGLSFEVRVYGGYRKVRFEVGLAWGTKVIQPEFVSKLIG